MIADEGKILFSDSIVTKGCEIKFKLFFAISIGYTLAESRNGYKPGHHGYDNRFQ